MKTTKNNLTESFKKHLKGFTRKGKIEKDIRVNDSVKENHILEKTLGEENYLYF